jgi:hypothetical protein
MKFLTLIPVILLSACATMIEGTSDTVTVSTTPAGATCTVDRDGQRIGALALTPGSIRIDKSRRPLNVSCIKEGYATSLSTVQSGFTGTTFANILLGGVIGVVVDAASGANSRYPQDIRLELAEQPRPAAAPLYGQMPAGIVPVIYEIKPMPGV